MACSIRRVFGDPDPIPIREMPTGKVSEAAAGNALNNNKSSIKL